MSTLTGTFSLVRLALRLDRVRLPIWVLVTVVTALSTASAFKQLYPDEASRQRVAASIGSNPALLAIYGPIYDTSLGAVTMWRLGIIGALLAGLMSMLTINRHTRQDEEAGRLELIGATVVGRHAPMAAALVVTIGANIVLALLTGLGLAGQGLPVGSSLAAGFAFAGLGVVLAAVTAVAAQLSENARTVNAIAGTVFGVAFVLRLVGDASGADGPGWLTWLSPVGWIEKTRAYAGDRWWVIGMMAVTAIVLFVVAYALVGRRDLGAGLVPPRPGPADAGASLNGVFGLAWRLQRWSLAGWAFGFAVMGYAMGSVASGVLDLFKDDPQMTKMMQQLGGVSTLIDAFMSAIMGIVALVVSVYAVQATLRMRAEETNFRAEPLLATNTGRIRWAASHLVYPLVGSAVMLTLAGLGAGIAYGIEIDDVGGQVGSVLGNALVQLPATLVVAAIALALFGLAPRFVILSWAALTVFVLLGQLGPILQAPQWLMDVSPFTHVPKLTQQVSAGPLIWLSVVAVVLGVVGLVGLRRRDIG
ncbi:ABC transporter permease [Actinocrispum sp. NPDC049592]|uniref:ABC transporter permease n=1 Tax=Actinocrispum sp. NPDC049592 TaxID=3154835 RepID=UPI0034166839